MGFDCLWRKRKPSRDLPIGQTEAGQRGNILLTRGEGFPLRPEFVNGTILCKAGGQDVGDQFMFGAAFVLGEFEGLKNEQVADILGLSLDTVKIRLHRARLALREKLSGYLNQDVPPEAATMTCEQLIPYLSDYIDNSIDEPLATAARQHIATCPHCHVLVDTTRQTITLMQAGKARVIPAADKTRLVAEIQSAFDERRGAGERT